MEVATIKTVFSTQPVPAIITHLSINPQTTAQAIIPANILNGTKIYNLGFACQYTTVRPNIDPAAFQYGTIPYGYYHMDLSKCNMVNQQNFDFVKGFTGKGLYMSGMRNLGGFRGSLPLPNLEELIIDSSTGLVDFPILARNKLAYLTLKYSNIGQTDMNNILNKALQSSAFSVRGLWLQGNQLIAVPPQTKSFPFIQEYDISRNKIDDINDEIKVARNFIYCYMSDMGLSYIAPGAFSYSSFEASTVTLGGNQLTEFPENVFKKMLDDMLASGPGVLYIGGSKFVIRKNKKDYFTKQFTSIR